ncbi:hypothetical protein CFC21_100937 [Triticum aestivum]|uniref:SnoaL-like domain-containing protein n=3 Tax=Triticum TaxID=4564 RepID=A0A9R1BV55_TRITD|nr:uncharacterized protein LOC123163081 isoform X1 [Triticum aestivum]KAF7099287.1 hypothetical protein CFC21_100937 [Triticum aestivum]VAI82245.1 unnamed protein product [Triticum turgidum subsp. durum]
MNSALKLVSFHYHPSFNLKQRPLSQRQQISAEWGKRQQYSPKPIRAIPVPNATGGLNNADRGGNTLPSSPMTNVIQEFYSSLNDKDIARLTQLIHPDCTMKHTSYYKPLDIKNTITYFARLMEAMRKNVKFAIDEVCHGVEPTVAAAMWHLEWNGKIIPFTKGCSFYTCSAKGEALLIRKVHIFNESPVKPVNLALDILLFVTFLFDLLPKQAEDFLQNPEALVQSFVKFYKFLLEPVIVYLVAYSIRFWSFVVKLYKLYVEPIIVHLLAYNFRFWSFVARRLDMVLDVLYNIFKQFM